MENLYEYKYIIIYTKFSIISSKHIPWRTLERKCIEMPNLVTMFLTINIVQTSISIGFKIYRHAKNSNKLINNI